MRSSAALLAAAALLSSTTGLRAADPSEKDACIRAAESGQDMRDGRQYKAARDAFARCARASCPGVVRRDCAEWLASTDAALATIVLAAQDEHGRDLAHARVTLDGQELPEIDGKPIVVDPGAHLVRWEADGYAAVEQQLILSEGEKNHLVGAKLAPATPNPPPEPAAHAAEPPAPAPVDPSPAAKPADVDLAPWEGRPAGAWVFAGAAIVGFASEAYFGLTAMNQRNQDLAPGGCAPHCGSAEQNDIRVKSGISDASLGVALVSTALAAYFFLSPRAPSAGPDATVGVAPSPGGAVATMRGRF